MARGDMTVDVQNVVAEPTILNRKEFEAVAMTVDFTNVAAVNGVKVVKAGTPLSKVGVPIKATPWTGAVGIVLHDVYESRPQVAMLKKAYIHVGRANANSGLAYDAALVAELNKSGCRIVLEEPITV